jgi:hypothetical protein
MDGPNDEPPILHSWTKGEEEPPKKKELKFRRHCELLAEKGRKGQKGRRRKSKISSKQICPPKLNWL